MERKIKFLVSAVYYITIAAAVFLFLKYAVFVVMPFVIGFAVAAVLNPAVRFLCRKFDMKRRPTAVLLLLLFYATIGMLATVLVVRLVVTVGELSGNLPGLYKDTVEPALGKAFEYINRIIARFDRVSDNEFTDALTDFFNYLKSSLGETVSNISVRAITALSGLAASVPKFIIELLFAVISSFFFIIDYEKLIAYIKSRLPARAIGIMTDIRDRFFTTVIKYIRSYALIMLITFAELFFGLILLGTKNAALYAFLIAVFDVLPVVGTGAVMLPWAIIEMIRGSFRYGIGLAVVWAVITVVRNIIEPKIVGRQVGLHPLLTLITMFVGSKLFGLFGLIILPVGASIAVSAIRDRDQSVSGVK